MQILQTQRQSAADLQAKRGRTIISIASHSEIAGSNFSPVNVRVD
jgi:hypothetical protein